MIQKSEVCTLMSRPIAFFSAEN